jgi:hypothetical protein
MTATHVLTPTEIAAFRRDGILLPSRPILPEADFAALRADFERLLPDWTGRFGKRPEEMDKPHFLYPELFRYATHPAVLDLVEDLLGPDLVLFTTHFICKPAGDGRRVPWHEDSAYWAGMVEPMDNVLTLWLALDPSTSANGCVRYVPGSHLTPDGTYVPVRDPNQAVFAREMEDAACARAEAQAIEAELAPNHASIHHAKIIHGSRPNHSPQRRCGLTLRYFSAHTRWIYDDPHFHIYLVRGHDRAGNRYGRAGVVNQGWRDRLLADAGKAA